MNHVYYSLKIDNCPRNAKYNFYTVLSIIVHSVLMSLLFALVKVNIHGQKLDLGKGRTTTPDIVSFVTLDLSVALEENAAISQT